MQATIASRRWYRDDLAERTSERLHDLVDRLFPVHVRAGSLASQLHLPEGSEFMDLHDFGPDDWWRVG